MPEYRAEGGREWRETLTPYLMGGRFDFFFKSFSPSAHSLLLQATALEAEPRPHSDLELFCRGNNSIGSPLIRQLCAQSRSSRPCRAMSGARRRTPHRKHVEQSALNATAPELSGNQAIALVLRSHGSNLVEIETATGVKGMAMIPSKFRKLVWMKRGDFVIVSEGAGTFETAGGATNAVRFSVDHVLFPDQVASLRSAGAWPPTFVLPEKGTDRRQRRAGAVGGDGTSNVGGGGGALHSDGGGSCGNEADGSESSTGDDDTDDAASSGEEDARRPSRGNQRLGPVGNSGLGNMSRGRPGELPPSDDDDTDDIGAEAEAADSEALLRAVALQTLVLADEPLPVPSVAVAAASGVQPPPPVDGGTGSGGVDGSSA